MSLIVCSESEGSGGSVYSSSISGVTAAVKCRSVTGPAAVSCSAFIRTPDLSTALAGWIVDSAPDSNVLPYDATVADLPGVAADPDTHHIFSSAASSEVAGLVSGLGDLRPHGPVLLAWMLGQYVARGKEGLAQGAGAAQR